MDKTSATLSCDRAQRLFDKNVELENKRRKSAQARVPSDPNAWYQMRENYEAIILEDHGFSEKHDIEYALWLLHYKRIEEFRAHFNAAQACGRSNASNGGRGGSQSDRLMKIRVQFKAFLSEATGFYHDLILKIRSKYGLPLGQFSENLGDHTVTGKDRSRSAEVKKCLLSCHRCLIYLGDLARYKGQYGEGESRNRDFSAASSYYLQAASLYPSSGNPHHQLAILASYSGDELVAVYRHFRSLAAEISFPTAKDNLGIVFEKNRESHTQLLAKVRGPQAKEPGGQMAAKGSGSKDVKQENSIKNASSDSKGTSSVTDKYKEFCIQFVRLNGILFTRTSLETFMEVLSSVRNLLCELLSSGPQEEHNFGSDTAENGLSILRLVAVLIFTVNNVNRKSEGQTYAECLQHTALTQNAATATFDLLGLLMDRCLELQDPSSSYLLPGILVFLEWLACYPDVASCTDVEKKPAAVKSLFWKHCITFLNKLLSVSAGLLSTDEGDETCFTNMSKYEEGENEIQFALSEDFELRGFLPLVPAQTILDFSRKPFSGFDGSNKEKKIRVRRILAAGKALASLAVVDQKPVYFDSRGKQFVVGFEPQPVDNSSFTSYLEMPESCATQETSRGAAIAGLKQANTELFEGDDEDEEIVFKPSLTDKQSDLIRLKQVPHEGLVPGHTVAFNSRVHSLEKTSGIKSNFFIPSTEQQQQQVVDSFTTLQILEQGPSLTNGSRNFSTGENGHALMPDARGGLGISAVASLLPPMPQSFSITSNGMYPGYRKSPEPSMPLNADCFPYREVNAENLYAKTMSTVSTSSKGQVNRPVRHLGPPPGFSPVPSRPMNTPMPGIDLRNDRQSVDEHLQFNGNWVPSSTSTLGKHTSAGFSHDHLQFNSNNLSGSINFPFPGKQLSAMQMHGGIAQGHQDYHILESMKGNQQFDPLLRQHEGQSPWNGQYHI